MIKTALCTLIFDEALSMTFNGVINRFGMAVTPNYVKVGKDYAHITFISQNGDGSTVRCFGCSVYAIELGWSGSLVARFTFHHAQSTDTAEPEPEPEDYNASVKLGDILDAVELSFVNNKEST